MAGLAKTRLTIRSVFFSYLAASCGFLNRRTAMLALRQFGKVEGQSWVKEILKRSGEKIYEDEEDE